MNDPREQRLELKGNGLIVLDDPHALWFIERGSLALFGVPLPYIAAWYQAPTRSDRDLAWLHLRVMSIRRAPDKLKYLAGSESAMGAFINDIAPEDMAARLRDAVGVDSLATLG